MDVSRSTAARAGKGTDTILEAEAPVRRAPRQSHGRPRRPVRAAAFSSDTRDDVRYLRIKDFDAPYDELAEARLAGLTSLHSTGWALRSAMPGANLRGRASYRRLLLIVTDGEPHDIDVGDPRYLVEDARAAVTV